MACVKPSAVVATVIALGSTARLLPHVSTQAEWMLTAAFNAGEWLLATLLRYR
jgi:hypothetical protein